MPKEGLRTARQGSLAGPSLLLFGLGIAIVGGEPRSPGFGLKSGRPSSPASAASRLRLKGVVGVKSKTSPWMVRPWIIEARPRWRAEGVRVHGLAAAYLEGPAARGARGRCYNGEAEVNSTSPMRIDLVGLPGSRSGIRRRLEELVAYRELLQTLVLRDLRSRYRGSVLGFLWTFLNPLLMLVVYSVVFSIIQRGQTIHDYALFLFTDLVPWTMVTVSLMGCTYSLIVNASLIKKVFFPSELIPTAAVCAAGVNYLLTMIILLPLLLIFRFPLINPYLLLVPPLLVLLFAFCLGAGLIISVATVYFRDFEQIVNVGLMAWFFLTPILYSTTLFARWQHDHPEIAWLPYLNPMSGWMVTYRSIFLTAHLPNGSGGTEWAVASLAYLAAWTVALLVGGYAFFCHHKGRLNDEL